MYQLREKFRLPKIEKAERLLKFVIRIKKAYLHIDKYGTTISESEKKTLMTRLRKDARYQTTLSLVKSNHYEETMTFKELVDEIANGLLEDNDASDTSPV